MAKSGEEYKKELELAFFAGGMQVGFAFEKVAEILAALDERIEALEKKQPL